MPTIKKYLSLIKFSHTIFAMPFALIGFFLGMVETTSVIPGWRRIVFPPQYDWNSLFLKFFLVIGCMIFARSAAMAFNRYLDRKFDADNVRTAGREIPAGILKADNVLIFTIVSSLLFVACSFFINRICFYLSPLALAIILGYSYTKRFTPLCHLILGLGLSIAPTGAYLAITGVFDIVPLIFSAAVLFWVSGFDIIYALQDEEFDKSQGLYSIPASVGKKRGLLISRFLHICSAAAIVYAGLYVNGGWLYWTGASIFIGMLVFQQLLVKPHDLKKVNIAFMTANGIASVLFAIFVIGDLLLISR